IGLQFSSLGEGLSTALSLANDGQVRLGLERRPEPPADDLVIVRDENPDLRHCPQVSPWSRVGGVRLTVPSDAPSPTRWLSSSFRRRRLCSMVSRARSAE